MMIDCVSGSAQGTSRGYRYAADPLMVSPPDTQPQWIAGASRMFVSQASYVKRARARDNPDGADVVDVPGHDADSWQASA